MQVCSINNSYRYRQPSFQSWKRETFNATVGVANRNDTCFFRDSTFIANLTKMLSENFKDVSKVNIYSFGCSDGSEPLSLVMSMLSNKKELNPQKFFPIIARDIDPVAINKAINNEHRITVAEKDKIDYFTNGQFEKFIEEPCGESIINEEGTKVFVKKEVIDKVDFAVGDIFEDYKKINPKNSVVMARNFWPYITSYKKRMQFFRDLYNHLSIGSYFIIGDFDQMGLAYNLQGDLKSDLVRLIGFKPTKLKYVYVKE